MSFVEMMPSKKESHIFEPRLILTEVRLCCDGTWDYLQSRVGRKRIRLILAPFFLVASIMLLVIGATWAKVLAPECGQSLSSAEFSLSSVALRRTLGGNSCPGYDWNSQTRPKDRETAGEYKFAYSVPLSPVIAATPTYVGKSNSIDGPIGVALNGIPIYGPSTSGGGDTVESNEPTYDQCGGFSSPPYRGPFSAPITGYYHYSAMPGVRYPRAPIISYCPEISSWYNETKKGHSPLAGFMADGIPIYGPYSKNGKAPTDLDDCGGHSTDAHSFYHYHFQNKYPYSVNCLRGCLDGSVNKKLSSDICKANATTTTAATATAARSNYTSLHSLHLSYGGSGVNHTNWTGPASLLSFGFILFLPSALLCMCICCSYREAKNFSGALSDMEQYDEHAGDNVL